MMLNAAIERTPLVSKPVTVRFEGSNKHKPASPPPTEKYETPKFDPNLNVFQALLQMGKASGWNVGRFIRMFKEQTQEMRDLLAQGEKAATSAKTTPSAPAQFSPQALLSAMPAYNPNTELSQDIAALAKIAGGYNQNLAPLLKQRGRELRALELGKKPEDITDADLKAALKKDMQDPGIIGALQAAFRGQSGTVQKLLSGA